MLGEKIRSLRKTHKISQEELAEKLGVSRQSISLWENGQTIPSMENIVAIANIFEISTDTLLKHETLSAPSEKCTTTNKPQIFKKSLTISSIVLASTIILVLSIILISKLTNPKLSAEEIFDLVAPSTVEINAIGDTFESTGTGSFIDNNGTIVTNYHVIESCHTISIKTYDGSEYKVEQILGYDSERDLAIIKADCHNEHFIKLETASIKTGEKVYTLGSSLGLTSSFSEGIISSSSREIDGLEFIQTTAPISAGNSGGPLVNEYGNVIGITTGAFTEGQNLNLAIPVSAIKKVNQEKSYSVNDFFQLSQGKIVEQEENESVSTPTADEDYIPTNIGYFNSLADLEKAAQRNPDVFKFPVIVSVYGTIARTETNDIYIFDSSNNNAFNAHLYIHEKYGLDIEDLKKYCVPYQVYMIDDTQNKVLTQDRVVIVGVYRHSAKTFSDCTYELINQ